MNASNEPGRLERGWKVYLNAAIFLGPPLLIWAALAVFVTPKVKQLCADAGAGPFTIFQVGDFVQENVFVLAGLVLGFVVLLEWKSVLWRRWRKGLLGATAFVINTAVIFGMANLLVVTAIVGPMLGARQ